MALKRSSPYKYEDYYSSDEMSDATIVGPPPKRKRTSISSAQSASESSENVIRRPGRKPSKTPSLNKNAQMARQNRERKKLYIENLEGQVRCLKELNDGYKTIIHKQSVKERSLQAEVSYLKSVLHEKSSIDKFLVSLNENLEKNRSNQEETCFSQNERITHTKELFSKKQILEDIKVDPDNELIHDGHYNSLTEIDNHGKTSLETPLLDLNFNFDYTPPPHLLASEAPLLCSKTESFDHQLPLTPLSSEDNSAKYRSLQDDLNILPPNLLPSENFDIVEYFSGFDEADPLDFGTQPFLEEETYFDMDMKTVAA